MTYKGSKFKKTDSITIGSSSSSSNSNSDGSLGMNKARNIIQIKEGNTKTTSQI
jgi:hypothetical protein